MRGREIERDSPFFAKELRGGPLVRTNPVDGEWVDGAGWQASFDPGSQFDKLVAGDAFFLMSRARCLLRLSNAYVACGENVPRRDEDDRADPWEAWQ